MAQRGGKRPGAGRPKGSKDTATREQGATLAELARANTKVALQALVAIASKGESEAARVSAATAILDRGYGKPTQSHEHSGPNGGPIEMLSDSELNARIDALKRLDGPVVTTH